LFIFAPDYEIVLSYLEIGQSCPIFCVTTHILDFVSIACARTNDHQIDQIMILKYSWFMAVVFSFFEL